SMIVLGGVPSWSPHAPLLIIPDNQGLPPPRPRVGSGRALKGLSNGSRSRPQPDRRAVSPSSQRARGRVVVMAGPHLPAVDLPVVEQLEHAGAVLERVLHAPEQQPAQRGRRVRRHLPVQGQGPQRAWAEGGSEGEDQAGQLVL